MKPEIDLEPFYDLLALCLITIERNFYYLNVLMIDRESKPCEGGKTKFYSKLTILFDSKTKLKMLKDIVKAVNPNVMHSMRERCLTT